MFAARVLFPLLITTSVLGGMACTASVEVGEPAPKGVAALGGQSHDLSQVTVTEIGTAEHGLNVPRDLAFNPGVPGELWVVNRGDDSVVRYRDVGTDAQSSEHRFAEHFMEEVAAISFSEDTSYGNGLTFATAQESINTYNDTQHGNNFMGPTLWTSDWEIFGYSNPEAVEFVGSNLGSHIDMMHESPLCMGIGWEVGSVFWTMDGLAGTISRYDFADHHFPGYDDHSDGTVTRYPDATFARVENVPSHIVYDHANKAVFYADTGNSRIVRFDPSSAVMGDGHRSKDHAEFHSMNGGELQVVANNESAGLQQPSGIALKDGVLYVTDHATSRIHAFDIEDFSEIDHLDTGVEGGSLMGLALDSDGSIYTVDAKANRVLRFQAKP